MCDKLAYNLKQAPRITQSAQSARVCPVCRMPTTVRANTIPTASPACPVCDQHDGWGAWRTSCRRTRPSKRSMTTHCQAVCTFFTAVTGSWTGEWVFEKMSRVHSSPRSRYPTKFFLLGLYIWSLNLNSSCQNDTSFQSIRHFGDCTSAFTIMGSVGKTWLQKLEEECKPCVSMQHCLQH